MTSTSTPASILTMICFTTSVGAFKLRDLRSAPILKRYPFGRQFPGFPHCPSSADKDDLLDQPLVDPHLISVPRLASFTTRGLPRRDFQTLCGQADRALHTKVLGFGTLDQFLANLFERLHLT